MKKSYVQRIGFGVTPYAVVIWKKDDEAKSKTICYDEQALQDALAKQAVPNSFYSQFEPHVYMTEQESELIA